jgi:DtxR family Mn-dependent transcriptional regulator
MTGNKEDYIKAIYELGGQSNQVSNKNIAEALNVSAPSVSEMIKKLLQEGYVEYTLYQGVKLTELGIKEAMRVRRKHLLWEVFLVEKLGYNWGDVDEEAERLEHATSEELERKLDEYLNYPTICPHGTPIIKDETVKITYKTLDTISIGETIKVRRLTDIKELLKYMDSLDLKIGDELKVVEKALYNGPITLEKNEQQIIIGLEAAKKIYVE